MSKRVDSGSASIIYISTSWATARSMSSRISTVVAHAAHWCRLNGCDADLEGAESNNNSPNIFGGRLGLELPVMLAQDYLLSSVSTETFEDHIETMNGSYPSVADNPRVAAAVEMVADKGPIIQVLVSASGIQSIQSIPFHVTMYQNASNDTERELIIQSLLIDYTDLPSAALLLLSETDADTNMTLLALVYSDLATARQAAQVLPDRIERYRSLEWQMSLIDMLNGEHIENIQAEVFEASNLWS